MDFYRTSLPGHRLKSLPRPIQPFAVFLRNLLRLTIARKEYTELQRDVRQKLSFGVHYVFGADVEGDFAEFGTASGTTATAIARAIAQYENDLRKPRNLHLFDSFRGLPRADSQIDMSSPHVKSGLWREGTCFSLTKEELFAVCTVSLPKERVLVYDGWFKDTLQNIPNDTKFAMVHIDCDLYQSTMDVLEHLLSHKMLQVGAAIFFDDWNSNKASPALGERKAWSEIVKKFAVVWDDCGEYGSMQRKVIVHSYTAPS